MDSRRPLVCPAANSRRRTFASHPPIIPRCYAHPRIFCRLISQQTPPKVHHPLPLFRLSLGPWPSETLANDTVPESPLSPVETRRSHPHQFTVPTIQMTSARSRLRQNGVSPAAFLKGQDPRKAELNLPSHLTTILTARRPPLASR